jgi:hypothetical protein
MMKVNKKGLLGEIARFLDYLQKNDFDKERRRKLYILCGINSRKSIDRVTSLCIEAGYIIEEENLGSDVLSGYYRVTLKGLRFLREVKEELRQGESERLTLFLTTMLVVTTIASFFNELGSMDPIVLTLIYGLFCFFVWLSFKSGKIKF